MAHTLRTTANMSTLFPTRSIALLMLIGFADLISTAMLHQRGLIVELNPIMRQLLDQGEWLFILVKSATLVAAWFALCWYSKHNVRFVRTACLWASATYLFIWVSWFTIGSIG